MKIKLKYTFAFTILCYIAFGFFGENINLAQITKTFTLEEVNYTVTVDTSEEQKKNITLSYQRSNGDTHTIKYSGICGTDIVNVLGESTVNSAGVVTANYIAKTEITFDISPNSEFEFSPVIRQAFQLICQDSENEK